MDQEWVGIVMGMIPREWKGMKTTVVIPEYLYYATYVRPPYIVDSFSYALQ